MLADALLISKCSRGEIPDEDMTTDFLGIIFAGNNFPNYEYLKMSGI
jgi:hypothetical protein